MEEDCCCCNYTFPEEADPKFKALLDKLNDECLNKNKCGFIKWKPINLLRNTRDGREGGRYTCIGVKNKATGLTIYNICTRCDATITKYRKFPFTSGVDVAELQRKYLETTKTVASMQLAISKLEGEIKTMQQTINKLNGTHTFPSSEDTIDIPI